MRLLLLTLCFPLASFAQRQEPKYDLRTKPSLKVTKEKKTLPAKPTVVAPVEEPELKWGGEVGYFLRTDLADQIRPRLYGHALGMGYGFTHTPSKISLSAGLEAAFESAGERSSEVLLDDDRQELFIQDFSISLIRTYSAAWDSKFAVGLANEFPTSPEAQRENYNSVTALQAGWSIPVIPKRLSLVMKSEVFYIWNSYEYSPATGDLNRQGGARLEFAGRVTLWEGWFVSAMAGSQLARFLDGTSDMSHRNAVGTGYAWEKFNVSLTMSNGTYLDREDASLWFVDDYRRMLSFGMRYSF